MAREQDPSYWTMSSVWELKPHLPAVLTMELAFITVATMKMLGFSAETVSGVKHLLLNDCKRWLSK